MHFLACGPLSYVDVYDINTGLTISTAPVPANDTLVLYPGGSLYDIFYQPSPHNKGYIHDVTCPQYCEAYILLC